MRIPNGDRANLGTKLEDYSLNPWHRDGRHKARVFASALGITLANADALRVALRAAIVSSDDASYKGNNGYGDVYELRFSLTTAAGTATVLTAWIVRTGEDFPRLITCFIL
jgi:hypothetical protein